MIEVKKLGKGLIKKEKVIFWIILMNVFIKNFYKYFKIVIICKIIVQIGTTFQETNNKKVLIVN